MVRDAVLCHFEDDARPKIIRLHFVREEVIAVLKLPRDLSGDDLAKALARIGYRETRQTRTCICRRSDAAPYCTARVLACSTFPSSVSQIRNSHAPFADLTE
jgi:hypothetical protein